jgi:hypothetical protein
MAWMSKFWFSGQWTVDSEQPRTTPSMFHIKHSKISPDDKVNVKISAAIFATVALFQSVTLRPAYSGEVSSGYTYLVHWRG